MKCRHCFSELQYKFLDLGFAPPSNAYLSKEELSKAEKSYPLRVKVCHSCWLVQTEDYAQAGELFDDNYAYFSSTSSSWLNHAKEYVEEIVHRLNLNQSSFVVEIASNDGYLLKNFLEKNIPSLGIEPTKSTAVEAEKLGLEVLQEFFSLDLAKDLAKKKPKADLVIGNNVYAHVPNINDFTSGIREMLKPEGVVTLEFPHLLNLMKNSQFDTVYHEHFSYLSLSVVSRIFKSFGLRIWDVEELTTHGGSLRIYGCLESSSRKESKNVGDILGAEIEYGLDVIDTYLSFQDFANELKDNLLAFLIEQKKNKKCVVAYGAAAKGNTLLNYAGVKPDLLPYVFDAASAKQFKYLPGSHIPILPPNAITKYKPDYVLILPWNIASEVKAELKDLLENGTKFVTAIPTLGIL